MIAEKITADALEFSNTSTTINPNESFVSGNANDIGYSAFYKAVCNQLIRLYGYQDTYNCYHFVGSCYFINVNLSTMRSPYGGKPFPPEFHFNVIVNTNTHEFIAVDPSLYESYRIGTVVMDNARKP